MAKKKRRKNRKGGTQDRLDSSRTDFSLQKEPNAKKASLQAWIKLGGDPRLILDKNKEQTEKK